MIKIQPGDHITPAADRPWKLVYGVPPAGPLPAYGGVYTARQIAPHHNMIVVHLVEFPRLCFRATDFRKVPKSFDWRSLMRKKNLDDLLLEQAKAEHFDLAEKTECGTVARALGPAPLLFPSKPDESWDTYSRRIFDR